MQNCKSLEILYLVNSALLFTHEVDSGYWKEWELFGLPGGIQLFLLMNMVLVLIGLVGLRYLVLQRRAGLWFSLVQAASGIFAFVIHGIFMLKGHAEFTLPVSMALLALTFLTSIAQGVLAVTELRAQSAPGN
jgi:hypothetical protein